MSLYDPGMAVRNFLVEGVSCTGKTSVCRELRERGHFAINGDDELAYQGDPATGRPTDTRLHEHHIWDVEKVRAIAASQSEEVAYFCGGSRNFSTFIDVFDAVLVLEVDLHTLQQRLGERPKGEFGGGQTERDLIMRLHQTKEDVPGDGITIDATAPLALVVDEIARRSGKTLVRVRHVGAVSTTDPDPGPAAPSSTGAACCWRTRPPATTCSRGSSAVAAGAAASSSALVGFGLDSFVEVASALVVIWQFRSHLPEHRERLALRLIAGSFFALAAWVGRGCRPIAVGGRSCRSVTGRHRGWRPSRWW